MPIVTFRAAACALAIAAVSGGALAAGLTGAAALKDRQAHMKALGAATKAFVDQMHAGAPDKAVLKLQADKIEAAAVDLPKWFPAGSGPETGLKTRALPVIWTQPDDFLAVNRRFADAAGKLEAAATAGDMAAVGSAGGAVGAACKACHDKFRGPEKK